MDNEVDVAARDDKHVKLSTLNIIAADDYNTELAQAA